MAVANCPALCNQICDEDELLRKYFDRGYTYKDIRDFMEARHGVYLTEDQLRRKLTRLGLRRRGNDSPLEEVEAAIEKERSESGRDIGYRVLHQRLVQKYKLKVGRDTVMMLSAVHDPVGAQERRKHKLKRREYHSKGPDYVWHMDGYDKLKPFGFCIHGCIDGYSRRIMWLHVAPSNNDPYIIAGYYLECVKMIQGCPTVVRSDRGTENCNVGFLQPFLRRDGEDCFSGENSFMYGKSTSNQRIEAWWRQLRKNGAGWWMDYFKELRSHGEIDDSNEVHMDCLRFAFMNVIQDELARIAEEWNTHRIRQSAQSPGGIPDVLYFLSHQSGAQSYKHPVSSDDFDAASDYTISKPGPTTQEFNDLASLIMTDEGMQEPTNPDEALAVYRLLKLALEDL